MKLGFQILILMVFCFSCKDEKVFDSSPSERNANHIGELRKELVNAPYGCHLFSPDGFSVVYKCE